MQRALVYLSSLSLKTIFALSAIVSTLLGAGATEAITNQWGSAALAGIIAGVFTTSLGAVLAFVPRYMEQRRQNQQSTSETSEREKANEILRTREFFEMQIESLKKTLAIERMINAERDLIATLERRAKHRVHSQLTAAEIKHRLPEMEYAPRTYDQLVGAEDQLVQEAKDRIRKVAGEAVAALT